jgi:hypothetical protein
VPVCVVLCVGSDIVFGLIPHPECPNDRMYDYESDNGIEGTGRAVESLMNEWINVVAHRVIFY